MTARVRLGLDYAAVVVCLRRDGALWAVVRCAGRHRDNGVAADRNRACRADPARAASVAGGRTGGACRQPHHRHPDLGRRDHRDGKHAGGAGGRGPAQALLFRTRLTRLRDVLLLVGLAALASTLISATFGVAAAALANLHRAESYPVFWAVWWLGDAMGALLIAPLICVWAPPIRLSRRPLRWLEGLLLLVALTLVSMMVFRRLSGIRAVELIRGTYAIVPLLIWAALRFEQRGITAALLLVGGDRRDGIDFGGQLFRGAHAPRTPADDRLLHGGHSDQHADAGRRAGRAARGDRSPRRIHLDRVARAQDAAHRAQAAVDGGDPDAPQPRAARRGGRREAGALAGRRRNDHRPSRQPRRRSARRVSPDGGTARAAHRGRAAGRSGRRRRGPAARTGGGNAVPASRSRSRNRSSGAGIASASSRSSPTCSPTRSNTALASRSGSRPTR